MLFPGRWRNLRVTLYSEPGYRGVRQSFVAAHRTVRALSTTRLPRVGSVRVERFEYTFRRASALPALLWSAITDRAAREEAVGWLPLAAIRALDPSSWLRQRDPEGDRQSWVRLWAEPPAFPRPRPGQQPVAGQPWHDFLEDTADVVAWSTQARYIETGIRACATTPCCTSDRLVAPGKSVTSRDRPARCAVAARPVPPSMGFVIKVVDSLHIW
jgi:hypothetical protein